ncbi:hypothetical protein ACW9I6_02470 [Pseudomonas sp. SDO5522_S412]|uniref:hypothetical protein n=1 Tax=Pseudomonas sp. P7779 TaxID=2738832 RepID=UPI0015C12E86|nr:hypothetical protein [Pseudomonas sp. P7779]NWD01308.1 hypothetical protein [Pseudomonas sp. P7779]
MKPITQSMFDLYALSLPWGLSFVNHMPYTGWRTDDGRSWGVLTLDEDANTFGCIAMRQRVDLVWTLVLDESGLDSFDEAERKIAALLKEGAPREPMPPNTARRPNIFDSADLPTCTLFQHLSRKSRHKAAWMIGHLYYSMPRPDDNWVRDFQTENLHTRLWELHLLACFREQGRLVSQQFRSPDFRISRRNGECAWIEAVTTNPTERYDHATTWSEPPPSDLVERVIGQAAVRYANTIRNKLQRQYDQLSHVVGQPFALAIADFHAQGSMTWSRQALIAYLYGEYATTQVIDGKKQAVGVSVEHLLGKQKTPAGLFRFPENASLSAIIFSNGCSLAKFGRVLVSMTQSDDFSNIRFGEFFDRTPGALEGLPFCLDVTSPEYRDLWPQGYEPWSAELEVFHNPLAAHPLSKEILPEATHWFVRSHGTICEAFYETQILHSQTLIQPKTQPKLTLKHFFYKGSEISDTGLGDDI